MANETQPIHGTVHQPDLVHPVLDVPYWNNLLSKQSADRRRLNFSGLLSHLERVQAAAQSGDEYDWVDFDSFVWSRQAAQQIPFATRLGGRPFRRAGSPWPRDKDGVPLVFLGQICFRDSLDILHYRLPGDVACIYGNWEGFYNSASVTLDDTFRGVLEWADSRDKCCSEHKSAPRNTSLPYTYHAVRCRTKQARGVEGLSIAYTGIGHYNVLPQGYEKEVNLIASINYFSPHGRDIWHWCDSTPVPRCLRSDGSEYMSAAEGLCFNIDDAGVIFIVRDDDGTFYVTSSSY